MFAMGSLDQRQMGGLTLTLEVDFVLISACQIWVTSIHPDPVHNSLTIDTISGSLLSCYLHL
jgi:hypothetical protein